MRAYYSTDPVTLRVSKPRDVSATWGQACLYGGGCEELARELLSFLHPPLLCTNLIGWGGGVPGKHPELTQFPGRSGLCAEVYG